MGQFLTISTEPKMVLDIDSMRQSLLEKLNEGRDIEEWEGCLITDDAVIDAMLSGEIEAEYTEEREILFQGLIEGFVEESW